MALGTTATMGLIAGAGAFSAASAISAGNKQASIYKRQGEFNAQVYEQQAEVIKEQKKIQDYQFLRNAATIRGGIVAKTAGKGLMLSGSPLAILADTESQLLFDKAIADYNLDLQQNYAVSGAKYYRATGAAEARLARYSGYSNAFSTLLQTGATMGIANMKVKGV